MQSTRMATAGYKNYVYDTDEYHIEDYELPSNFEDIKTKIGEGTYPTWTYLKQQQLEKGETPKSLDAKRPEPFPSKRSKQDIFKQSEYTEKDEHARSVVPQTADTWEIFGETLFEKCVSNLDKLRACFVFTACVDPEKLSQNRENVKPGEIFDIVSKIRKENNLVNDVFERLLEVADILYEKLSGLKKSKEYNIGHKCGFGGCWFACYIGGEWRLVDMHWGSTNIVNFKKGNFNSINETSGEITRAKREEGKVVFNLREQYFLTAPEDTIVEMFPKQNEKWQLLPKPLTEKQFNQFPRMTEFTKDPLGIEVVNYPLNVIVVPQKGDSCGKVEIIVRETLDLNIKHEFKISLHEKSTNNWSSKAIKEKATGGDIEKFIRLSNINDKEVAFIFSPPCEGKYLLELTGILITKTETHIFSTSMPYLSYVIHCPVANPNTKQLPKMDLNSSGVGYLAKQHGITGGSPGEVKTNDGECEVFLETEENRDFSVALWDKNKVLSSKNVLSWRDPHSNKEYFHILTNNSGQYVMTVYNKAKIPICQFLVEADTEYRDSDFPLPNINKHGGLGFAKSHSTPGINAHSQNPYVTTEMSELNFDFDCPNNFRIQSELVHCQKEKDIVVKNFTIDTYDNKGNIAKTNVKFPQAGNYILKTYAINNNGDKTPLFNYLIRQIGYQKNTIEPFPKILDVWNSNDCKIISPKSGIIPIDKDVDVEIQFLKDVKEVSLVKSGTNDRTNFTKEANNIYKTTLKANSLEYGQELKVSVSEESNSVETQTDYFGFNVEEKNYKSKLEKITKQKQIANETRKQKEAKRKIKKENTERMKQGLDPIVEETAAEKRAKKQRLDKIRQAKALRRKQKLENEKRKAEIERQQQEKAEKEAQKIKNEAEVLEVLENIKTNFPKEIDKYELTGEIEGLTNLVELSEKTTFTEEQYAEIDNIIVKAKNLIIKENKLKAPRKMVHTLQMDSRTLIELRQYANPPEIIHQSVQAFLLLLGFYEKKTRKWKRCQPLLVNIKKTTSLDLRTIHPEIAARAEEIIVKIDRRELGYCSAAAEGFCVWSVKAIGDVKSLVKDFSAVRPANAERQKVILKVSDDEDEEHDFEDYGIRKRK